MAVRIALQCSEADAHLILSEDNPAARLLTRPGEAIYNDANGLVEGNNFFQVVWLSDERREDYLRADPASWPASASTGPPAAQIVFEGNLPGRRRPRTTLLDRPARRRRPGPSRPEADQAWLGDAIAIKDPTAAVFRPQSGSNLLIVGQNDEAALGIMTAMLISLAAQSPPADSAAARTGARFYLLDGSPVDSPLRRQARPARRRHAAPGQGRSPGASSAAVVAELAAEVERRQQADAGDGPDDLPAHLRPPAVPRPPQGATTTSASRGYGEEKAAPPSKQLRQHPPRRPGRGRPHDRLVRQPEQPEPDLRPPGARASSRSASCSR